MAIQKRRTRISRSGGDVIVELKALKAQPIEGVLSNFRGRIIEPEPRRDESIIVWRVPAAETTGCVFYGVITPLGRIWGAPRYERLIAQDGALLTGLPNPVLVKTHKLHPGEWVGPPEAIRFL